VTTLSLIEQIFAFQHDISQQMEFRIGELEEELEGLSKDAPTDPRIKNRIETELEEIVDEIKELEKFSRINFTGFMKVSQPCHCSADNF
jgi:SPX domain protein involved in polyphosphate accumulation